MAWILLLWAETALRLFPARLTREAVSPRPGRPVTGRRSFTGEAVGRALAAVDRAARHHLFQPRCLARSLVLQRILAAAGLPTTLCIGVRKIEDTVSAHAWLERDGVPLDGEGWRGFAPLAPGSGTR